MIDAGLLDLIYEAAAVPELWPGVLAELVARAGAMSAGLLVFDPLGHMQFTATAEYRQSLEKYAANSDGYDNKRPKRALASGHAGFLHDLEVFTQAEMDVDPVYVDFIYPAGIKWTAGTVIPAPTQDLLVFDFARSEAQGPFDRDTMLRLDQFRPHMARAALLSHRLGLRAARAATEAMGTIGVPAAMVDAAGHVLSMNAQLEALPGQVSTGAFDRLRFTGAAADQLLQRALMLSGMPGSGPADVQSIPLAASGDDPALVAHVLPIRRAASDIFARSAALIVFTPVTAPASPMAEVLTGLFDLTAAETRVARGIGAGQTLEEIAAAHGLSPGTVRNQLKMVFFKTGTSRQAELALLLSGLSSVPLKAR